MRLIDCVRGDKNHMEILSSGSFINLDNEEKIEQLVFTAQEIAETAIKTEGFEANEENNKKLALDIWQGAEYMCRDSEEVQVKNIFISNFLERMREISVVSKTPENRAETSESKSEITLTNTDSKDEYLGLVQTADAQEQESSETDKDLNESSDESDTIEIENSEPNTEIKAKVKEIAQIDNSSSVETVETETTKIEKKNEALQIDSTETNKLETLQTEANREVSTKQESVGSIVLPEKEPYQFDKCTVTATIQLLPTDLGTRKVVMSVRTHDFPPQISVHELFGEVTPENLLPELEKAFERYKGDLPVKVMDKLRKEKDGGKKKKKKRSTKVEPSETSQTTPVNNKNGLETDEKSDESVEPSVVAPQTEINPQGSLFGN